MATECLEYLEPSRGGIFVDCTLGLGGHSLLLLEADSNVEIVGIDRDPEAIAVARDRLAGFGSRVRFLHGNYDQLEELLGDEEIGKVAGILADLGMSSMQLERGYRGFSLKRSGPLDMRMNPDDELTAAQVVNEYSEGELQRIFSQYGEERRSRRIAREIVGRREVRDLRTTDELRDLVASVVGRPRDRHGRPIRIDPATRVFQALRIEVNQELAGLKRFLAQSMRMLETDGRLVVISYHSLEDRIVKSALRDSARGDVDPITGRRHTETQLIEILTKKPLRPSATEVEFNPRSRSARLRAARRI
jgi:16S rRNA (cytosine1402-N4)-methyltransferase